MAAETKDAIKTPADATAALNSKYGECGWSVFLRCNPEQALAKKVGTSINDVYFTAHVDVHIHADTKSWQSREGDGSVVFGIGSAVASNPQDAATYCVAITQATDNAFINAVQRLGLTGETGK